MSKQSSSQTRFVLNESDLPKFWYNINADSPVPPAPVLNPQTKEPVTPGFPVGAVPDGADHAGGQHRAVHRDPGRGARAV